MIVKDPEPSQDATILTPEAGITIVCVAGVELFKKKLVFKSSASKPKRPFFKSAVRISVVDATTFSTPPLEMEIGEPLRL